MVLSIVSDCNKANCEECDLEKKCAVCKRGFQVDNAGNCKRVCNIQNCDTCGEDGCAKCTGNFVVKKGFCAPKCTKKNCKQCNSEGECTECEDK